MSERDSFLDLERHRKQLEDSITKLQQALRHWQTWDAEYEALKEELGDISQPNESELTRIRENFEGELVNRKEVDEIFGSKGQKSRDQIVNVLGRRIDYVTKNIESLQKQIETLENKLAAATVISQPDATDEEGLPITEILEELDEQDNVVSYRLNKPGDSLPQVQEALTKAGVKDLSEVEGETLPKEDPKQTKAKAKAPLPQPRQQPAAQAKSSTLSTKKILESVQTTNSASASTSASTSTSNSKGVSFASDAKSQDGPKPQVSRNAKRVEEIMNHAKEQEKLSTEQPVIPDDEDEDDAELRRQMLAYSGEVGAVVAELQLEEGDTEDDEEDYDFEYSDEGFDEEFDYDDEEDKYGRSTGIAVTDKYRRRMLELEQKLGVKSRFTEKAEQAEKARQEEDGGSSSDDGEGIGRIVIKRTPDIPTSTPASTSSPAPVKSSIKEKQAPGTDEKKGVRFATNLDIAAEDEAAALPIREAPKKEKTPLVEPLSDIVERSGPAKSSSSAQSTRKPSRFKKAAASGGLPPGPLDVPATFIDQDRPTAPTGPAGKTLADTLVERESTGAPRIPEDFDEDMLHDQVADEYQRMRKKFIQRDGGFLKEDENPIQPLDEPDGGKEPVSRFKAAKLAKY